ncbi:MAG: carbon-nitrogen hydrolase family protein [Candidatus Eisenbacteria sp.]|nr:carbon-nitrogen hydrolase family protein [Candidatus Eisenbacteria bacterium]
MERVIASLCCTVGCIIFSMAVVLVVPSGPEASDALALDRSDEVFNVLPDEKYGPLVRVALVQLEMLLPQDPQRHIADAFAAIDEAGQRGVDLIVLPEGVNIGSGGNIPYRDVAERADSRMMKRVSYKAAEYNCHILFPFIELRGKESYNSAALFDRSGSCLGVYRKVHEPRCVVLGEGVFMGDNFPVFDTDIGRIGILICYDAITPEPALIYGLEGVDLIVFPHMIQPLENEHFHITTRARAIDASLHIAAAGWARPFEEAGGRLSATCFVDWEGKVLAQGSMLDPGIVYCEARIGRPRITEWLGVVEKAEWRKVLWGERRPHLYGRLTKGNAEWRAWCPSDKR